MSRRYRTGIYTGTYLPHRNARCYFTAKIVNRPPRIMRRTCIMRVKPMGHHSCRKQTRRTDFSQILSLTRWISALPLSFMPPCPCRPNILNGHWNQRRRFGIFFPIRGRVMVMVRSARGSLGYSNFRRKGSHINVTTSNILQCHNVPDYSAKQGS